ncbi:MAG: ATP-binding protein [Acutalibacteraceae bacterium]
MIKLITGAKGTGKTKIIIDMANDNVETAKGDIVFLTDTDRYMYSLRYQVRVINTDILKRAGEKVLNERELIGFIKGILAGNHDIESFYIDGAHRMLGRKVTEMEDFFTDIYAVAKNTETRFILTVSENEENFPEFLKKYQGEV